MYDFCTYFDANYYPRARALYESLARQKTEFTLYALCLDEESRRRVESAGLSNFVPIALADLEAHDPELAAAKANRSRIEYYFTCTAAFCLYVMERFGNVGLLTYLDADLYFFDHPRVLFDELEGASIGIIAHRYSFMARVHKRHGIYNVGWVSFRRDEQGLACVRLWRAQCIEWCYDRVEDGKFADQKYLDHWPARFSGVKVIGHLGANVGSWNIANNAIREVQGRVFVGDVPLIFFHFACFSQLKPGVFNTSFGGNYVFLTRMVRRCIFGPYIDDLLRFSTDRGAARRERMPDAHIDRLRQTVRRMLRAARGVVFNEYIRLPQADNRRTDAVIVPAREEPAGISGR